MESRVQVLDDAAAVCHAAAQHLARSIARAVLARGVCHIALPGGPFVRPIYSELAQFQLAWSEVAFYFTDERCVPATHPASNFGEAIDRFLHNPRIGVHQFQRIEAERADREAAAEDYARVLPDPFDVLLAEVGVDGHVAALYPDSPALRSSDRAVLHVQAPTRPRDRITLSRERLRATLESVVVAAGRDRAAAVARALAPGDAGRGVGDADDVSACPARIFRDAHWIVDRAAAGALA